MILILENLSAQDAFVLFLEREDPSPHFVNSLLYLAVSYERCDISSAYRDRWDIEWDLPSSQVSCDTSLDMLRAFSIPLLQLTLNTCMDKFLNSPEYREWSNHFGPVVSIPDATARYPEPSATDKYQSARHILGKDLQSLSREYATTRTRFQHLMLTLNSISVLPHFILDVRFGSPFPIIAVSGAGLELTGYNRKELLGKMANTICTLSRSERLVEYQSDMQNGLTSIGNLPICTKDQGSVQCVMATAPIYDTNGRAAFSVVLLQDIKANIMSEAFLHMMVDVARTIPRSLNVRSFGDGTNYSVLVSEC